MSGADGGGEGGGAARSQTLKHVRRGRTIDVKVIAVTQPLR